MESCGEGASRPTAPIFLGPRRETLDDGESSRLQYSHDVHRGGPVVRVLDPGESNFVLGIVIGLALAIVWHVVVGG